MNTTLKETLKTLVINMKAFLSANYPTTNSLTGSAEIATKNSNTVVIKAGISESAGVISNSAGVDITLADVASTGLYADLSNKPAIKAGQGVNSIIEGDLVGNSSIGTRSHAEGYNTTASGGTSHAEGNGTTASGGVSHAEGYQTQATGPYSHAEGTETIASGNISHTEGAGTTAKNRSQHAFGEFNELDPSTASSWDRGNYIEIVGNGADDTARSNARTLDWQGNEVLAGNLVVGGTITANGQEITPTEPQVQADWNQNDSESVDYIKNKPTIPSTQVQADWNQTTSEESDYILNKPTIKAGQGSNSTIEGDIANNVAEGAYAHAEGHGTVASGTNSHAEGYNTTASGDYGSHAEGYSTTASGENSHAEGCNTTATGNYSHAEGYQTQVTGNYSHTEGYFTTANHKSQHVFGEHNIADPSLNTPDTRGNYVEIVGNGAYPNRSNARTLDWSGNETLAGNLTVGGTITANGQEITPAEPQTQSDWNQNDSEAVDYIKNKPTKLSDFINDGEGDSPLNPFTTTEDVTNRISAHNSDITTHEDIRLSVASQGGRISAVEELIPAQATSSNNLADKEFVNSSISTNTANFKGTYNTLAELEATTADNNDYGFIITTDASGNTVYNRYKYDGTSWSYEYSLNNSAFTVAQWGAIQSGITSVSVTKLNGIVHDACKVQTDGFTKSSGTSAGSLYIWNTPRAAGYYASPDSIVQIFYPEVKTANGTISADSSGVIDISGPVTGEINSAVGSAVGSLTGEINLREPLLPAAPEQPESKFLNANKQWVEIGGGGLTTVYKSITIENPTASENMCIFYAPVAMTITEIRGVITGATSVSFKVVSGTSRNAVTTEHNSSAVVCSSVTTGDVATITTAAVAAGSWVAVKTSAIAGAPSELVITLSLNY